MPRPRKKIDPEVLKHSYSELGMSTTEISAASKRLFGFQVSQATVYNHLVRLGVLVRTKSQGVSMAKSKKATVCLAKVAGKNTNRRSGWNTRYWNARWLVATGEVQATNSKLTTKEAARLAELLDQYGDRNALPESLVKRTFKQARREGFPYLTLSRDEQEKAWTTLTKARPRKINGSYPWVGLQTTLATMFHPHIYECRKKGRMTPLELFNSDEDLKRAIRKAYCLHGKVNRRILNDICRNENAAGRVGNFPPRVGKTIISELWPEKTGLTVLDPCAGFSGRMFACAASGAVSRYVGIDLSKKTYDGLVKSRDFLRSVGCDMEIDLVNADCILELKKLRGQFDIVLTSPPFFNVEEYAGVQLPSNYDRWLSSFLRPMVERCYERLRRGGRMALYIERVRKFDLPKDCIRAAVDSGMQECEPIRFLMHFGKSSRQAVGKHINVIVLKKPD